MVVRTCHLAQLAFAMTKDFESKLGQDVTQQLLTAFAGRSPYEELQGLCHVRPMADRVPVSTCVPVGACLPACMCVCVCVCARVRVRACVRDAPPNLPT